MKSYIKIAAAAAVIFVFSHHTVSLAGTVGGGGSRKPTLSFSAENFNAILHDQQVNASLTLNREITSITRLKIDSNGWTYKVTAEDSQGGNLCILEVDVHNTFTAPVAEVKVTGVRILQGCSELADTKQDSSVLTEYASFFDRFTTLGANQSRPYEARLAIARSISKEERQRIREFMKNSNESKFYAVYSSKAKQMADFVQNHPNVTEGQFYEFLGKNIMGLDVDGDGIVIPVLVGMDFATLFIVDAQ